MAGLKTLVIVLGIAIIIGVTAVVMTLIQRAGSLGGGPAAATAIPLAAGDRVLESDLDGERILLRVRAADGAERLVIVRAGDGRVLAVYALGAEGGQTGGAKGGEK